MHSDTLQCTASLHVLTLYCNISLAHNCDSHTEGVSVRPHVIDQQDAIVLRLQGVALHLILGGLLEPYSPT